MIYLVLSAASIGVAAGLSPGPLMALLIAESLRGGWPAGFRVSLAPLVTDSVLVSVALFLGNVLPPPGQAMIGTVGGGVIMWMGWGTIRSAAPVTAAATAGADQPMAGGSALARGIMTNLLNPHAFLFWLTFGAGTLRETYASFGLAGPLSFMGAFFGVMISINLAMAFGISRGRHFLNGPGYVWSLRVAGAALTVLGAWRLVTGVQALLGA